MSAYRKKVFPLRLPQKYHGQPKPIKKPRQEYKQKSFSKQIFHQNSQHNPQFCTDLKKIVNWQLKRNNKQITNQRRQFFTHTGKLSHDSPHWFQTTNTFYRRNQVQSLKKKEPNGQQKKYDVFNRKRLSNNQRINSCPIDQKLLTKRNQLLQRNCSWNVTGKVGQNNLNNNSKTQGVGYTSNLSNSAYGSINNENARSTSVNFYTRNSFQNVTTKIGSVQSRDFSVKRPQMKIGKTQYIDTYTPF